MVIQIIQIGYQQHQMETENQIVQDYYHYFPPIESSHIITFSIESNYINAFLIFKTM